MLHMDFHNDLFFTYTYTLSKKKKNLFTKAPFWSSHSATVRQMKALFCSIIWICYHILLQECLHACDACSERGRETEKKKKKGI